MAASHAPCAHRYVDYVVRELGNYTKELQNLVRDIHYNENAIL